MTFHQNPLGSCAWYFSAATMQEAIDTMKPLDIIEEEELQRLSGLLQRENLLRALGVIEQVYRILQNTPSVNCSVQTAPPCGIIQNKWPLWRGIGGQLAPVELYLGKSLHLPESSREKVGEDYVENSLGYPKSYRPGQELEELGYIGPFSSSGKNTAAELGFLNPSAINWSTLLTPHGQAPVHINHKGNQSLGMGLPLQRFQHRLSMRRGLTWTGGNHLPVSIETVMAAKAAGSSELRLNAVSTYPRSLSAKFSPENSLQEPKGPRGNNVLSRSGNSLSSPVNTTRISSTSTGSNVWNMKMNAVNPENHGLTVVSARAPMNQRAHLTRRANILNLFQSDINRRLN